MSYILFLSKKRFKYTWHEVTEKGFMFATPWRWKSMNLNAEGPPMPPPHTLREGLSLQITDFQVHEESTKPPDYLQVCDQSHEASN